ncbi:MAG: hypothetical protein B7Z35_09705 [Hydrogenophilales bacterium 12-61-10]|nr:MAG: hypothetical protein B7Z35_09705 [Hydrogenophilales bacterium 12-61-10]
MRPRPENREPPIYPFSADLAQPSWLWFTAFVGFNLFQSGFTRFCPLDTLLKKAGVKQGCGL